MIALCRSCGDPYCDTCADVMCECGAGRCQECADAIACHECRDDHTDRMEARL